MMPQKISLLLSVNMKKKNDNDCIPSDDNGKIDEIVPALFVSDEEFEDNQGIIEQTLVRDKNKTLDEFYIRELNKKFDNLSTI